VQESVKEGAPSFAIGIESGKLIYN